MTNSHNLYAIPLSANDAFKLQYPRYIKMAILAALALTTIFIWQWPGYEAEPYQLREKEEMIWVDIPDPINVEEPPIPLAPPVVMPEIEIAPYNDPTAIEIDWLAPDFWDPSPTAPVEASSYDDFVASSALPKLKFQAQADYPELARRMRIEGTVMVHVLVGATGKVNQAIVIQSVHPTLDKAAIAAARKCQFAPAKQREMTVKSWVAIPYRFKMN